MVPTGNHCHVFLWCPFNIQAPININLGYNLGSLSVSAMKIRFLKLWIFLLLFSIDTKNKNTGRDLLTPYQYSGKNFIIYNYALGVWSPHPKLWMFLSYAGIRETKTKSQDRVLDFNYLSLSFKRDIKTGIVWFSI